MAKWLNRLRRLLGLFDLLRTPDKLKRRRGTGGGGGGSRSGGRPRPEVPGEWRVGARDYVTVGGRSFVLQRGPGGSVRVYDASGRPVAVAGDRGEADEVMAEVSAEASRAEVDARTSGSSEVEAPVEAGNDAGGEA